MKGTSTMGTLDVSNERIAKWLGFETVRDAFDCELAGDFEFIRKLVGQGYTWSGGRVMADYYASSWTAPNGLRAVCVEDGPAYAVHDRPTRKARWNNAATALYATADEATKALIRNA